MITLTVDTIRIAVAHPVLLDAHGPPVVLVGLALKLRRGVAGSLVAVLLGGLVRVIDTVVVSVADVGVGNAVAVVAREQVAEARPVLGLALALRLVLAALAILVAVAVPRGRQAPVVGTPERVGRTRSGAAVQLVLVRVVATIVIAVAQPVRLQADGGGLAGQLAAGAGDVLVVADGQGLVGGGVVLAVVDAVADLRLGDAAEVVAGELSLGALRVVAVLLVRPVAAVVLVVALPGVEDASAVAATELLGLACVNRTVVGILI